VLWLYAILALSVLIIVHELGHFVCAKWAGMHVDVFSVLGIGPVIVKLFHWRGTDFVISAIPFGAYVHIVGMEPEDDEDLSKLPQAEREAIESERRAAAERAKAMGYQDYRDRPAWARALALFGGPAANYVAAILLALAVYAGVGINQATAIAGFGEGSAAQAAGLRVGDVYVSIAGEPMEGRNPRAKVIVTGGAHAGETVDVVVRRDGELLTVPVALAKEPPILGTDLQEMFVPVDVGTAIGAAVVYPFAETAAQLSALGGLITGATKGRVGGPVAMAKAMKDSATQGVANFVMFAALISTALGMFNLLPMPALDGGRLVFVGIEAITRRKISPIAEGYVHLVGLVGLLLLIGYATVGDIRMLNQAPASAAPAPAEAPAAEDPTAKDAAGTAKAPAAPTSDATKAD
jgi:regulator of sigma E protease